MVGASPGRGDNGTETSLNNSCSSRRGTNRLHEGFHQEGEERKALSKLLGVARCDGQCQPSLLWLQSMPVPTPRGPRAGGGAKQGERHHCCHKAEVTDTPLLSGSELPGLIASPGAPKRPRLGSSCGALDAFKVEMGMVT